MAERIARRVHASLDPDTSWEDLGANMRSAYMDTALAVLEEMRLPTEAMCKQFVLRFTAPNFLGDIPQPRIDMPGVWCEGWTNIAVDLKLKERFEAAMQVELWDEKPDQYPFPEVVGPIDQLDPEELLRRKRVALGLEKDMAVAEMEMLPPVDTYEETKDEDHDHDG